MNTDTSAFEHDRSRQLIRARFLFLYLALAVLLSVAGKLMVRPDSLQGVTPIDAGAAAVLFYGFLAAMLLAASRRTGLKLTDFPMVSSAADVRWAALVAPVLIALSFASVYAVYLPLSYIFPDFVEDWLFDPELDLFWLEGEHYSLANSLMVLAAVVLAPVVEEFFFRGLLLRTWAAKWGTRTAVVASSAVFAVLHIDQLGAFVFSVVVSLAYIWTRNFLFPVLIHMANNALGVLLEGALLILVGTDEYTLDNFRADWWTGAVGFVVGVPALIWLLRHGPRRTDATVASDSP